MNEKTAGNLYNFLQYLANSEKRYIQPFRQQTLEQNHKAQV